MGADDDTVYVQAPEHETSGYDPAAVATGAQWDAAPEWAEGEEHADVEAGGAATAEASVSALDLYNDVLQELLAEDPELAELLTDEDLRGRLYEIAAESAAAAVEGQAE